MSSWTERAMWCYLIPVAPREPLGTMIFASNNMITPPLGPLCLFLPLNYTGLQPQPF